MPIDRVRRDELGNYLACFLRGEIGVKEFNAAIGAILREAPQRVREDRNREGPGFPLAHMTAHEMLDDLVLDYQAARAVYESLLLIYPDQGTRKIDEGRSILIRTLCLLRSELDERDLSLPRNATVTNQPLLKLGCLSSATFFTAVFAMAFLESPSPLLLWPLVGVLALIERRFLVRASDTRDDPTSFPFRTRTQCDALAELVPADEILTFVQTFEKPRRNAEKPWPIWKHLCFSPLLLIGAVFTTAGVLLSALVICALYLAIWPFFLYDQVRIARRPQWK